MGSSCFDGLIWFGYFSSFGFFWLILRRNCLILILFLRWFCFLLRILGLIGATIWFTQIERVHSFEWFVSRIFWSNRVVPHRLSLHRICPRSRSSYTNRFSLFFLGIERSDRRFSVQSPCSCRRRPIASFVAGSLRSRCLGRVSL